MYKIGDNVISNTGFAGYVYDVYTMDDIVYIVIRRGDYCESYPVLEVSYH
jgi:hypothetical protein